MGLKEKIYQKLPIFLQTLACNLEGYRIVKRRYSKRFFEILDSIKERDKISREDLKKLQIERLKKQLIIAYEQSEYYKKLFDELNFDVYNFDNLEILNLLPIQTKQDLQENIETITNKSIPKESYIVNHTSGSTGSGLIFNETTECENEKWAIWWRYRLNNGIDFNSWCGYFGGRGIVPLSQKKPPFFRVVKSTRQVMFSMYHLNRESLKSYLNELNSRKLTWLHGYPSTLSYIASLMLESGLSLDYELKYITVGSESLLQSQREIIKRAFKIYPIQHYGLTEPVANISECEYGNLHIDEDYSYVELIPIENIKNSYKIIGSSFTNDAVLFLRYDTGDIATITDTQKICKCGRVGRIVDEVDGRQEDLLTQLDNSKVGRLDHIFKDMINIVEAQIIQSKDSGFVEFLILKGSNYTLKDEELLKSEIESRLNINYKIVYVDRIDRTKAGKLRLVVSK